MATNKYHIIEKIGGGSYGVVYKAKNLENDQIVAIKYLNERQNQMSGEQNGIDYSLLREIVTLQRIKNQFVLSILNVHYEEDKLNHHKYYLVFPYYDMDLYVFIQKNIGLYDVELTKRFLKQLLVGLNSIHQHGYLHRDLKPSNILIKIEDGQPNILIADFGLSRAFMFRGQSQLLTSDSITLNYRPPELLLGEDYYSRSSDIWSLGCVFFNIAFGHTLFNATTQIQMLFDQFRIFGTPKEGSLLKQKNFRRAVFPVFQDNTQNFSKLLEKKIGPDGADLIISMLRLEQNERINCENALQHRYFQ